MIDLRKVEEVQWGTGRGGMGVQGSGWGLATHQGHTLST